jgi:putative membrane protein
MKNPPRSRTFRDYFLIWLKGAAMGTADLVPGVSGGTVALITGIYDELLNTIASLRFRMVSDLFRRGIRATWKEANASFMLALAAGIFSSIALLSSLLHHLLAQEKEGLYSFFFGLVAASVPIVGNTIGRWKLSHFGLAVVGTIFAAAITSLPILEGSNGHLFLAACASIAACAMILPGISGSFILLLLGAYGSVIGALKEFDVLRIGAIAGGAIIGLLTFSRVLQNLLIRARSQTLAVLTGFLLGSLQALWPWKQNSVLLYTHSDGRETWSQSNAIPSLENADELIAFAILALLGAGLVFGMDRMGRAISAKKQ